MSNINYNRRDFIKRMGIGAAGFAAIMAFPGILPKSFADEKRPPNIINILVDDLGWGDLGCYGNPDIKTPNIDKLAKEGTLFTQFYVNGTTCAPTRVGIMTGHFPAYHHYHFNPKGPEKNPDGSPAKYLDPNLPLIPKLLKKKGYATGHYGKWHLGNAAKAFSPNPSEYGFDEHCTHMTHHEPHLPRYWDRHDGNTSTLWSKLTGMIVDDSIDFAKRHKDEPFYLNVWNWLPHAILNPTDEQLAPFEHINPDPNYTREKTGTAPHAIYYASVYNLDQEIGRLMKALDELGLSENTLVTFASDNGPEDLHIGNSTNASVGSNGPFRGRKRSIYEGGVRTPLIVRWPGKVRQQRVDTESVITGVDYLPTFCALADVKLPEGYRADGEDVSDIFFKKARARKKPLFWRCAYADEPFLGHFLNKSPILGMREGDWKFLMNPDGSRAQLYNIPKDPSEMNNLVDEKPEIVEEMKKKLLTWHNGLPKNDKRFDNCETGRNDWRWPKASDGFLDIYAKLVFKDDFNKGSAAGWVTTAGAWGVKEGAYIQSEKDNKNSKFSGPKDLDLKDFILKFNVQMLDGDVIRVLLREEGSNNYTVDIGKHMGWSMIKSFSKENWGKKITPVSCAIKDKEKHQVIIQAIGEDIKMWVDDSQCAHARNVDLKSGTFKLGTWLAKAKFYDVEVYEVRIKK